MAGFGDKLAAKSEQVKSGTVVAKSAIEVIEDNHEQLVRALPGSMSPERFTRIVATELRKNPRLQGCTRTSLLGAVLTAAQLGLEPGALQQVYLIPRRIKGRDEVQFQLGYRGMIELALRGGRTIAVAAEVVHEADEFEYRLGTDPYLDHVPALTERGNAIAAYAVAHLKEGGRPFVVLNIDQIQKRRGRSQSGDSGPWATDWDAMARKSAVRALAPYLPQTPEFATALTADEGVRTDIVPIEEFEPAPAVVEVEAVEPDPPVDGQLDPSKMTKREIVPLLNERHLSTAGRIDVLRARLVQAIADEAPFEDPAPSVSADDEGETADLGDTPGAAGAGADAAPLVETESGAS